MAPDASFSLFPRPEAEHTQRPRHKRRTSSKSSTSSPSSSVTSPLRSQDIGTPMSRLAIPSTSLKQSGEFERTLDTVQEEKSVEHSPITPSVYSATSPSTFVGSIKPLHSNSIRRSRTPSPPRIHTDFSRPLPNASSSSFSSSSPAKAKKPALRTSQLPQPGSYSLPLSPPPADELPPLPSHVEARRKSSITTNNAAQSPATTASPASSLSPASAKPPSSATTESPHTPAQFPAGAISHKKGNSSTSTKSSLVSPHANTTSPQFAFSPSLITSKHTPVAYPSIPQPQSPPIISKKSKSMAKDKSHSSSPGTHNIPPPPPRTPPHRRPSDVESTFSGSTARTYTSPPRQAKPSRSIFPTYDPNVPLETQKKHYGPQQQLQFGGYYAPGSGPSKGIHHTPSIPNLSSRPKLTARALEEHEQSFDAPPLRVGTAPTLASHAPRQPTLAPSIAISNRPPIPRASSSLSHYTPPNHAARPTQKDSDVDPALIKSSWNALTFVVGVGVEVVGGAMGGFKSGIKKERAKRQKKKAKKDLKAARSVSRWNSASDGDAGGYPGRIVEVEAKVSDEKGEEVRKERIDFRI